MYTPRICQLVIICASLKPVLTKIGCSWDRVHKQTGRIAYAPRQRYCKSCSRFLNKFTFRKPLRKRLGWQKNKQKTKKTTTKTNTNTINYLSKLIFICPSKITTPKIKTGTLSLLDITSRLKNICR